MTTSRPQFLYRYRRFSDATLDSLCNDTLYFANPATFNDPLDCKPVLVADSSTNILRSLLQEMVTRRISSEILDSLTRARVRGARAEGHADKFARREADRILADITYHSTNPDYQMSRATAERWLLTQRLQEELEGNYERGVCCFSTVHKNPLLWSHYGDKHRGICLGYDLNRAPQPMPHKVIYGQNRLTNTSTLAAAILDGNKDARQQLDYEVLLREAPSWRYEREWRLFGQKGLQDSPLRLRSVTFGLRCPISVIHTVVKVLQDRGQPVKFYEIYSVHGSYKLARRQSDLDEMNLYFPKTSESPEEMFDAFDD